MRAHNKGNCAPEALKWLSGHKTHQNVPIDEMGCAEKPVVLGLAGLNGLNNAQAHLFAHIGEGEFLTSNQCDLEAEQAFFAVGLNLGYIEASCSVVRVIRKLRNDVHTIRRET